MDFSSTEQEIRNHLFAMGLLSESAVPPDGEIETILFYASLIGRPDRWSDFPWSVYADRGAYSAHFLSYIGHGLSPATALANAVLYCLRSYQR